MGEEADIDYDSDAFPAAAAEESGDRVHEWEAGLPAADDLTPLSQSLIPRELAAAFSISPEPSRTLLDVHRASRSTLISLRRQPNGNSSSSSSSPVKLFRPFPGEPEPLAVEVGEELPVASKYQASGSDSPGKVGETEDTVPMEDADSAAQIENNSVDENSGRSSKRPRLVWTPQLHKRFVDVVSHLGLNNAVPKTIMQLMNVEGLTRENVASHLQKYRLYVKRMQGLPDDGPSPSDQLFASASVPQNAREAPVPPPPPRVPIPVPVPYAAPSGVIPVPVIGMASHGHGGMLPANGHPGAGPSYPSRFEPHRPHAVFGERPREWPRGSKFSRTHVPSPTDK